MSDGNIIIKFIPLRDILPNEWAMLNKALDIIANYGALGARISQGNGVIKIVENNLPYKDKEPDREKLEKNGDNAKSPNLNNFFFYKYHLKFRDDISNFLPIAFHIRDALRGMVDNEDKWHKIFGEVRENIRGSKVFVSHGYKDERTVEAVEVRIWGYEVAENIKNRIKDKMREKDSLKEKLFAAEKYKELLESCKLTEETTGEEILEGLK